MENEYADKVYQNLAADMVDALDSMPKYMTCARSRISRDLLKMSSKLLGRIYYLEQQLEKKK